ncbi:hypothetical protein ACGFZH_12505 [Streptomyces zaomyceticus]|uniref:hypothetical protein n=1 Tax=Streptomyces zaomyceticus TaxID=68286 RepID=UPI003713FF13
MTRSENEVDQIVFRWDSENSTGSTGFGPVAWSGPRDEAENLYRISGPVLRASGEETRPALIRLQRRADVMLIRRLPFKDADGGTSVLCHALVGSPGLLEPATCLGLHAWNWEGADVNAERVRGRLPVIPEEVLLPAAGRGQGDLDGLLAHAAEELTGTVAELLRHPEGRFTVLDERGDTACPVLWGLHSMFGALTGRWAFATHDTVELSALRFVFVGQWAGAASPNTERRRVDPLERIGDRADVIAARLVRHHLRGVAEGDGGEYAVGSALHASSSALAARRASLLETATQALQNLDRRAGGPRTGYPTGPGAGRGPDPGAGRPPGPGGRPTDGAPERARPPVPRQPAAPPEPPSAPSKRSPGRLWPWASGGRSTEDAPPPDGRSGPAAGEPRGTDRPGPSERPDLWFRQDAEREDDGDRPPPPVTDRDRRPGAPGRDLRSGAADRDRPSGADGQDRPSGVDGGDRRSGAVDRDRPTGTAAWDRRSGADGQSRPSGAVDRDRPSGSDAWDRQSGAADRSGAAHQDGQSGAAGQSRPFGGVDRDRPTGAADWDRPSGAADRGFPSAFDDRDRPSAGGDRPAAPGGLSGGAAAAAEVPDPLPYEPYEPFMPAPSPPYDTARPSSPAPVDPRTGAHRRGPADTETELPRPPADSYRPARDDPPPRPGLPAGPDLPGPDVPDLPDLQDLPDPRADSYRPGPADTEDRPGLRDPGTGPRPTRLGGADTEIRPDPQDPPASPYRSRPVDPPGPDLSKRPPEPGERSASPGRDEPPGAPGTPAPGKPGGRTAREGPYHRPPPGPDADPYPRPVLPSVEPAWTGPGGAGGRPWPRLRGRGREREAETGLVHKLPTARSAEEARALVERAGSRELLDALRRPQVYVVLTLLLRETARRLPSWEHPLRRELCEVALGRELWAVGPAGGGADPTEPAEEQRAANAAELHRWAVRPLLSGGDAPVGTVGELLSRLRRSPAPSAREAFWLIVDGERPGLPEAVWLGLLREAYGIPRTAPRPGAPASPAAYPADDPGNGYTRRFLRRAGMLLGGLVVAILLLVAVGEWFG